MIRQFTFIPALLGIAALAISACSAELGETGSGSGSGSSSSGSSVASQNNGGNSNYSGKTNDGVINGLPSKIKEIDHIEIGLPEDLIEPDGYCEHGNIRFSGEFLLEDGSLLYKLSECYDVYYNPSGLNNIETVTDDGEGYKGMYRGVYGYIRDDEDYSRCALNRDSEVFCWGSNEFGQIGNGTYTSTFSEFVEFQSEDMSWWSHKSATFEAHKVMSGVSGLARTNLYHDEHSYCALKNDDVYCWGNAPFSGAFGVNVSMSPSPILVGSREEVESKLSNSFQSSNSPKTVVSINNASCEIKQDGKVFCSGRNSSEGKLFGENNKTLLTSETPLEIIGVENAISFPKNNYSYGSHLCVLRSDNKIQCWGDELKGEIIHITP